jgi:hypothetical protein
VCRARSGKNDARARDLKQEHVTGLTTWKFVPRKKYHQHQTSKLPSASNVEIAISIKRQTTTIIQSLTYQRQPNVFHAAAVFLGPPIEVFPLYIPYYSKLHCKCLKLYPPISRLAAQTNQVCYLLIDLSPLISQLCIADDRSGGNPTTTPNLPLREEFDSGDSLGLLFSVYSKTVEDGDNRGAKHWQKDAEGIVIFVSSSVDIHTSSYINSNASERPILCRSLCPSCYFRPGPETEQSGYLGILPSQHISGPG